MDSRFKKINKQITEYALGNFKGKLRVSKNLDEIDGFITCINMLGEELRETTISKKFFNNIFNSVSDMVFVLDTNGHIQNTNNSVHETLHYPTERFRNKFIDTLEVKRANSMFGFVKKHLKNNKAPVEIETSFKNKKGIVIPVLTSAVFLYNEKKAKIGYLIVAKDLTNIKAYENSLKESEKKYREVFEESSDGIFISDKHCSLLELNAAGQRMFNIEHSKSESINFIKMVHKPSEKKELQFLLRKNRNVANFAVEIKYKNNPAISCLLSAGAIENAAKKIIGFRGIIKDISQQKETEKLVLKTIVDTQETERKRFAKDIHDSLGQQLSAIKFYLGASVGHSIEEKQKNLLLKANAALVTALADMRNICFDLMPKTLENFGLVASLQELCKQTEVQGKLQFKFKASTNFPSLNKQLEIAVFRIAQEFINNSIKHSGANTIFIGISVSKNIASVILKDNGKGFNIKSAKANKGMGLLNIQTRILPYNGEVSVSSIIGQGTQYKITIPLSLTNIN